MNVHCTISLRFQGIILRVLRLEVSVYNVYIANQFQTSFAQGVGGDPLAQLTVNSKEENSYDFCPKYVQEFGLRTGGKGRPNCSRVGERTWTV
jgi:hypothetical protein